MDCQVTTELNKLTYLQFSKTFAASNIEPKPNDLISATKCKAQLNLDTLDFIVTHDFDNQEAKLYKLVRSDLRLWEQIISNYPGKSQQS